MPKAEAGKFVNLKYFNVHKLPASVSLFYKLISSRKRNGLLYR